jgi:hypothetical protein
MPKANSVHEAPAPIGQKAQPATTCRARKTAKAITTRARGFGPALFPGLLIFQFSDRGSTP